MTMLQLLNRESEIFTSDIAANEVDLSKIVNESTFLVIGGAGSIGQAVTKEIFKRNLVKFYVVGISKNKGSELVKYRMSSFLKFNWNPLIF